MYRPEKKFCHNKFRAVPVATARKLFETYGFSRASVGHPDNTDPYHFTDPSNPVVSVLEELGKVNSSVLRDAYASKAAKAQEDLPADESDKSEPDKSEPDKLDDDSSK